MSALLSILLGIIQGLAEFLPISSSGHLSVLQNLININYSENEHMLFDVLLHFGTLISVIIYYRKDLKAMISETSAFLKGDEEGKTATGRFAPRVRTVFYIIIATLPLLIVLPFYSKLELLYYNSTFIAIAFIVTGFLLHFADKITDGTKNEKTISPLDALLIGLAQAIAVIPGLSRSGTTIAVGLTRGLKRNFAVKFSFLLSIPAVAGSTLVSLVNAFTSGINWSLLPVYLLGVLFAAVVGYFSIKLVNILISKSKFGKISYYCWGIGAVTFILSLVL